MRAVIIVMNSVKHTRQERQHAIRAKSQMGQFMASMLPQRHFQPQIPFKFDTLASTPSLTPPADAMLTYYASGVFLSAF